MMPKYAILLPLFIFLTACSQTGFAQKTEVEPTEPVLEDMVFAPADFNERSAEGLLFQPDGISPTSPADSGSYTSAVLEAPHPFNAVVPQWQVDLPEGADFHFEIRTGIDEDSLGAWTDLHEALDWTLPEDDDTVGDMLVVPLEDQLHHVLQFRWSLNAPADSEILPLFKGLRLTVIDSTAGPSTADMLAQQEVLDQDNPDNQTLAADSGYPKPFVISRDVWCTSSRCDYTNDLNYYPVSHLILHHTVSSTAIGGDSAATVRAIWSFHTTTRGWRDIGYNYLVDTEGVIYEGHLGGDDVVGIHASGANTGSMAVALIGTYSETVPHSPMVESAVNLFSWKADQKGIDVFGAGDELPGIEWGLPYLMGHRDVYGTTQCPGSAAHALLPTIREQVAQRIGFESPHIYVDELSPAFTKSNANWYVGPYQCGYNTHAWYTYSTTDPAQSANWAEWRPTVPENGLYEIEVYAPYCNTGRAETAGATYKITHAGGTNSVTVNQDDRIGLWTSLGKFNLRAGNETVIYLDDMTQTDNWRSVWFDAIRLRSLEVLPSATNGEPGEGQWLTSRAVSFYWQIENPDKVAATVLQVATDAAFTNRIANEIWPSAVYNATVTLDQDYAELYWRVVLTTQSGSEYPSAATRFAIDTEPPTSKVERLNWFVQQGNYQVYWDGEDSGSGLQAFNIDVRPADGDEDSWERWLTRTEARNAVFVPSDPAEAYAFRSRAFDRVGNKELLESNPDITTAEAKVYDYSVLLPMTSMNPQSYP